MTIPLARVAQVRRKQAKKSILRRRRRNHLRKLRTACLTLGLATAWGGHAAADVTLGVSISPTVTLNDAVIVFGNNVSTHAVVPIGDIPGGQTTNLTHTLTGEFDDTPEKLAVEIDAPFTGYYLVASYEREGEEGVVIAFRDEAVVIAGLQWADLFLIDDRYSEYHNVIESDFIAGLASGGVYGLGSYARSTEGPFWNPNANLLSTPYGETSVLVGFSTATAVGSMVVTILPEPDGSALIACGAMAGVLRQRRRP